MSSSGHKELTRLRLSSPIFSGADANFWKHGKVIRRLRRLAQIETGRCLPMPTTWLTLPGPLQLDGFSP